MKTETRKFARIATVVCGSVAPFAAHAQQIDTVAESALQSAAAAAPMVAGVVQPDEESTRASANLPIVDAAQTDAQCVTDAASARSVPVSYAAPIAVPGHTDTVANMSTETAAPVVAAAQANELEWGEPRDDAAKVADVDLPSPVRPVPLEEAARMEGAPDVPHQIESSLPGARHADKVPPAKPVLLPNVQRPVHKAPVSYAAPIAVPVHAAGEERRAEVARVEGNSAEVKRAEVSGALANPAEADRALAIRTESNEAEASPSPRDDKPAAQAATAANVVEATPPRVVAQTPADGQPMRATPQRRVSYAAPVAVPTHDGTRAMSDAHGFPPSAPALPQAKPFALAHVKSSAATAPVVQMLQLPGPSVAPSPSPRADSRVASTPAALPSPPAKPPVSYAAPIAVTARADSSASAKPNAQSNAQQVAQHGAQPQAQPAQAAASTEDPQWSMPQKVAISDDRLDKMRGGFDLSSGLKVSFGISRMVVVNGNLVTTTSFNIPDISHISAQQAQQLASVNAGALVQNGPGNVVQPGALPSLSGAVIQNTLSNQQIQALTTINTTVNSLSMFKNANIGSTLSGALVRGR
ncbi:hypothetical protein [Paraburkholderia rhizosphaerae]|uniref:Uncharacterized protein n=1 Tax=Paraburkholderia rhizosphaerae TaxID=480658 RepID=A0A4R8M380_9BURK|nr:hypothetical protein [Paraburkholderia rhizosphaerae]TDY54044.1 hypothetical protein BX592_102191 [Paraburkholderia rhizosphaerae]